MITNLPNGRKNYFDASGEPLAGGSVAFYTPGTTTPITTYSDYQQLTANTNPVILDAAGSCTAFGTGTYREYVLDAQANVISDSIVVSTGAQDTSSVISPAMLPVVGAPTIAAAEALLVAAGGATLHLNLNPADQTLQVAPTGNAPVTAASLNVQGAAIQLNQRDFLVNLGLTSNVGKGGTGDGKGGNDKVTLYAGITASPGTADVWSVNTLLTQEAGSGSYNAQGIELDFNNLNANRGSNGGLLADYSAPVSNGMSVTGAGTFTSTTGVAIESQGGGTNPQWARGLTTLGTMKFCGYQEWSTAPVGIQFDGAYSVAAINLTSVYGNAGGITPTALFLKAGQNISWQNAAKTQVISDSVDVNNNRVIGLGSAAGATSGIIMGAATIPLSTADHLGLGTASNIWGDAWVDNLRLQNDKTLTWANAAGTGLIVDYVDTFNNRTVGANCAAVFMGAVTAPITPGFDLGTTANYWGTVYAANGFGVLSDINMKQNVKPLPSMLDVIREIRPVSYRFKQTEIMGSATHLGFSAQQVKEVLDPIFPNAAAHLTDKDGKMWLRRDELIAVLWRGMQELTARVRALECD